MLIDHSADLKKLWDEGYNMEVVKGHLMVKDVPYLTAEKQIKRGTFVTVLSLNGDITVKPETHVAYFQGELPCNVNGERINMVIEMDTKPIAEELVINFTFSAKVDYQDYYHKVTAYMNIICSHAQQVDYTVTPRTFQFLESQEEKTVFNYTDTNSSRAQIGNLAAKFNGLKIAIVGLGGTGSYLLDFISKTPVAEIHLFDGDNFLQHNAFRAPGAANKEQFFRHLKKVEYLETIYANLHKGIVRHAYNLDATNTDELEAMDYVFVSIDPGESKKAIVTYLQEKGKPFIHTGISVQEVNGLLKGQIKTTTKTDVKQDHLLKRVVFTPNDADVYDQNIQISELNALNACFAIIKWKKLLGFYSDLDNEHFSSYVIFANEIINDDLPT